MRAPSQNIPPRFSLLKAAILAPGNGDISCALTPDELKKNLPNRKAVKIMDRRSQLACGAFAQVITRGEQFDEETGIAMAVGSASLGESDISEALAASASPTPEDLPGILEKELQPLWLLGRLPNMTAAHVSIQFQILGPSQTCGGGSLAGIQALSSAARWLQNSSAKKVLVGASESYLEAHWQIALRKKPGNTSEMATALVVSTNPEEAAIAHVDGPIHITRRELPQTREKYTCAFTNAAYFHDSAIASDMLKGWSIGNSGINSVWRVGEEMKLLASCAIQKKNAAIVRLLDEEHAVIFCIEPAQT